MGVMRALRVMTFNLRRDVEADGEHRWKNRRDAAASLVREEAPHVLGTQEGLAHQLADLDARLPGYARIGRCRRGDGTDEACAIYYDTQRLRLVAWGDLWLSDRPSEPGSRTWGNRHPRLVTWARFEDLVAGGTFTVANTHLDHESEEARQRGARFLAERLPGAILMGDFNATPGEPTHAFLLEAGWADAHAAHEAPGDDAPTFHGFTGRPWARLDWILAPRTHKVRVHRVPVKGPGEGRYVSDHHPVVAELEPIAN